MRRTAKLIALAVALAGTACATAGAQQPTTQAPPPNSPVATRHPYEMEGRVQSVGNGFLGVGGHSLTVAREGAPPAVLHVVDGTQVALQGRGARLGDLRPGDDVRVTFDFDKDAPIAIRIDAKPHR
jgi:hypothetical protein